MTVLQFQVLTTTYLPPPEGYKEGVQVMVAIVQGAGHPLPGEVWEPVPASGSPWTVHAVDRRPEGTAGVTLSRPAAASDSLASTGLTTVTLRPERSHAHDWRKPFRP
jgi:hypothetical protein